MAQSPTVADPADHDTAVASPIPSKENQSRPISPSEAKKIIPLKKPEWLKIRPPAGENYTNIKQLLRERNLHTVCEEAHCPNVAECWASGTATFMVGTEVCTRACRFCAIQTARRPPPLDPDEPFKVAEAVSKMKLKYVVLTSVDRDDLPDGGAGHFAKTIRELKRLDPNLIVEALVSDFRGDPKAVETIVDSGVDVYAHNIETIYRLQYRVRDPRAGYHQSLGTLQHAKNYARSKNQVLYTKSSIMLGLGEETTELHEAFTDLRKFEIDVLTLGQYLRPSMTHLPVEKYLSPEEFKILEQAAVKAGFMYVAAGPMVRSSYKAAEFFMEGVVRNAKAKNQELKQGEANGI
jgi:lipoic acid synthetase